MLRQQDAPPSNATSGTNARGVRRCCNGTIHVMCVCALLLQHLSQAGYGRTNCIISIIEKVQGVWRNVFNPASKVKCCKMCVCVQKCEVWGVRMCVRACCQPLLCVIQPEHNKNIVQRAQIRITPTTVGRCVKAEWQRTTGWRCGSGFLAMCKCVACAQLSSQCRQVWCGQRCVCGGAVCVCVQCVGGVVRHRGKQWGTRMVSQEVAE